jgi:hypothetical protein
MKIKKGKLNYDQSGRAYPPNPRVKENWDCIWEYEGKYYKLVGDNEHKEWDEVNIYNQIIDEVYRKYMDSHEYFVDGWMHVIPMLHNKETFINECKTSPEFSEKWGLKIEERELSYEERCDIFQSTERFKVENREYIKELNIKIMNGAEIPTKLITLTYNNETIESYDR